MTHPNFLPLEVKNQLQKQNSEPFKFRVFLTLPKMGDSVILGLIFVAAIVLAFVGYPVIDGAYRAYKLYPRALAIQKSLSASDFKSLYTESVAVRYQLTRLARDTNSLAKFGFVPVIGPKIESINYSVAGSEKVLTAFLPPLKTLALNQNSSFSEISAAERKEFINHLAAQSQELKEASILLEKGGLSFGSKRLAEVLNFLDKTAYLSSELPQILGTERPARYLILFANNLEIRPAGGFIGSYGLMTVKHGEIADLAVRDVYELPGAFNLDLGPQAPAVMQRYLRIRGLPFRDSNWSPDYPTSVEVLKQAYAREGGEYHHDIQGVITISTEVLREIMEITGEVMVGDVVFNADNVVNELEKQVEVSFWDQGIPWNRRKDIVGDLAHVLRQRIDNFGSNEARLLLEKFEELTASRHIVLNFENEKLQQMVVEQSWDGSVPEYQQDTLMVVDANLGGHKTEGAMVKNYKYSVTEKDGKLLANLHINYRHRGRLNQLVHNYRTYVRVYVPEGSRLVSVNGGEVEESLELNRTVFGSLVLVPIGQERSLNLTYELPNTVARDKTYTLQFLKQIGAYPNDLLLNFDFGNVKKEIKDTLDGNKVYSF